MEVGVVPGNVDRVVRGIGDHGAAVCLVLPRREYGVQVCEDGVVGLLPSATWRPRGCATSPAQPGPPF
jgi:hypothetical protein